MIWRIIFSGSSARSSRSVTLAAMISRVREKIPILLTPVETLETLKNAGAGAGQGGECPGTRAGQAKGLTAGDAAAVTARTPTGCPALKAICGWSITPTRMANAPTALSAKVAAWANVVFMGQPSWSRCSGTPSCQFVKSYAGVVGIGHRRGKAAHYAPMWAPASICLANQREILPIIVNGAENAVYRPVGV